MKMVEIKGELNLDRKRVMEKANKFDELFVGQPETINDLLSGFLEIEIACLLVERKYSKKLNFSIPDFIIQALLKCGDKIIKPIQEQYEKEIADETEQRERADIFGSSAECVPGS